MVLIFNIFCFHSFLMPGDWMFQIHPHSTSRHGSGCRHAHNQSEQEGSHGWGWWPMLEWVSPNMVPLNISDRLHIALCFSRCPGLLGYLGLLWLEVPRNYGNLSSVSNNNSLQLSRMHYVQVILLSFDHSIDYS